MHADSITVYRLPRFGRGEKTRQWKPKPGPGLSQLDTCQVPGPVRFQQHRIASGNSSRVRLYPSRCLHERFGKTPAPAAAANPVPLRALCPVWDGMGAMLAFQGARDGTMGGAASPSSVYHPHADPSPAPSPSFRRGPSLRTARLRFYLTSWAVGPRRLLARAGAFASLAPEGRCHPTELKWAWLRRDALFNPSWCPLY